MSEGGTCGSDTDERGSRESGGSFQRMREPGREGRGSHAGLVSNRNSETGNQEHPIDLS
jgi:hypothetical protein